MMQFMKELIREEKIHMQIHYPEHPPKYYMPKLLMLDKEDNVMIYVCSCSHRSYIVIDPLTCGDCPPSLLAKNSAPSRDTSCASKNP